MLWNACAVSALGADLARGATPEIHFKVSTALSEIVVGTVGRCYTVGREG